MTIPRMQKAADQIAAANIGYDQGDRWSFFDRRKLTIQRGGEGDCSSTCGAIARLAGVPVDLGDPFYTGNFAAKMKATGLFDVIRFRHLNQVRDGDFLVGPGHVIFARTAKKWWSAESDERGKSRGGRAGDQTGREARYRAPYARSRGWANIVRYRAPEALQRQILAAHAARKAGGVEDGVRLLSIRSPWDGPRWRWFMGLWAALDRGMPLHYDPATYEPTGPGHAFVVLGSALTKDGTISDKMRRRLALAKLALDGHPDSVIVVSGGAPRAGVTEAAAGKAWLVEAGVDPARIIIETKSASTIGNALNTVPLLTKRKLTTYTLVSDASHLRRASILFLAARLRTECATNTPLALDAGVPLAYNDYAPNPVKPERPVDDPTRTTVTAEVRQLLGL